MNLILLKTYLAIVENGSLVKASKALHVTQSTVTSRLQMLEDEIGQTLINRQKSGITLTAAGDTFKRYASALSHLWQQALQDTSLPEGTQSIIHLGCDSDLWPELGRKLAQTLHSNFPGTALSIRQADSAHVEQWLQSGLITAALSYQSSVQEGVASEQIGADKLQLYSPDPATSIERGPHYIYVELGENFGQQHAAFYTNAGVAKYTCSNAVWALQHLLDSGGSAYLPERIAAPYVLTGELFHLATAPTFERPYYLTIDNMASKAWPWLLEAIEP